MKDIMFGLSVIAGVTVIAIIALSFVYFMEWFQKYDNYPNHISFNRFLNLRKINPDKWYLGNHIVIYKTTNFSFGLISYFKYKIWKYKLDKCEEKMRAYKAQQEVINDIKKDIEEFKAKNEKEMKQGLDKISDERWKKVEKFKREQLEIEEEKLIRKRIKIEHL